MKNTALTAFVELSPLEHSVFVCNLHSDILDKRESHSTFSCPYIQFSPCCAEPCDMAVETVDGKTHEFAVCLVELFFHACKVMNSECTQSEVSRMAEQDDQLPL
jgi:hypothetical protein